VSFVVIIVVVVVVVVVVFITQNTSNGQMAIECRACSTLLPTKLSSLRSHFASSLHIQNREATVEKSQEHLDLLRVIKEFRPIPSPNLPDDTQLQRLQFLKAIFTSGVPLRRTDPLRRLYEQHALKLTSPSHLADYLPALQHYLNMVLLREVTGQHVNMTFDSTSSKSDIYCFCFNWMDQNLDMQSRLARVGMYQESLVSAELGRVMMDLIFSDISKAARIASASHDSAALNGAAMQLLTAVKPNIIDLSCICHLADLVASKLQMPELHEFFSAWHQLFAHSLKAKLEFKEFFSQRAVQHSATRYRSLP
jgi:hypothetical protein